MTIDSAEFRQKFLEHQPMNPALRASYEQELQTLLRPRLTPRMAMTGIILLVLLLAGAVGIGRSIAVGERDPLTLVGWVALAAAFCYASGLLVRDLWQRKHSPQSASAIAQSMHFAAATVTIVALLRGLQNPSDPALMFNAFFVFVFYVSCLAWRIESRIAAAQLAATEHGLRIELRLVDLVGKLRAASKLEE